MDIDNNDNNNNNKDDKVEHLAKKFKGDGENADDDINTDYCCVSVFDTIKQVKVRRDIFVSIVFFNDAKRDSDGNYKVNNVTEKDLEKIVKIYEDNTALTSIEKEKLVLKEFKIINLIKINDDNGLESNELLFRIEYAKNMGALRDLISGVGEEYMEDITDSATLLKSSTIPLKNVRYCTFGTLKFIYRFTEKLSTAPPHEISDYDGELLYEWQHKMFEELRTTQLSPLLYTVRRFFFYEEMATAIICYLQKICEGKTGKEMAEIMGSACTCYNKCTHHAPCECAKNCECGRKHDY